jgi:multidrug resistance protein, MATE family
MRARSVCAILGYSARDPRDKLGEGGLMSNEGRTIHPPGGWRELFSVAWPLVISSGSLSLMFVVDRVFLTWYSQEALAAAMPAGMVHFALISLFMGTAAYTNTFVAQYEGAGRPERVSASLWQGIYFALAASLVVMPCGLLGWPIFSRLGHEAAVARLEADYFAIQCYGTAPMLLSAVVSCFYSGRGRNMVVMWVNLASVAVDLSLDYAMIFGWGPFPEMGVRGAAISNVIGATVGALLFAALVHRDAERAGYGLWEARGYDRDLFRRLLRYGLPSGFHWLVDIICWTAFLLLVGRLGTQPLAATNLAFNLNSLVFVPLLGVGTAVMTLTGQRIGDGRPELAVRTTWIACGVSQVYTIGFAAVYLLLPDLILAPYRNQANAADFAEVSALVVPLLRFVAVYSAFDALAVVFGSAIRGAGDTRFVFWYTAIMGALVLVAPTVALQTWWEGGMIASWCAATIFVIVMGLGFLARFHGGRWKSMRVIEAPPAEPSGADTEPRQSELLPAGTP